MPPSTRFSSTSRARSHSSHLAPWLSHTRRSPHWSGTAAPAVATVAALIGGIGAFCGAIVNVLVGVNLAAAVSAHMTQEAAARFLVTTFNSGFEQAFSGLYFIGVFVAPVLMGFALWRSRSVARWLTVLFVVGLEVAQQQSSSGLVAVVLMLPFGLAMVLLSARIWRAAALPAGDNLVPALVGVA